MVRPPREPPARARDSPSPSWAMSLDPRVVPAFSRPRPPHEWWAHVTDAKLRSRRDPLGVRRRGLRAVTSRRSATAERAPRSRKGSTCPEVAPSSAARDRDRAVRRRPGRPRWCSYSLAVAEDILAGARASRRRRRHRRRVRQRAVGASARAPAGDASADPPRRPRALPPRGTQRRARRTPSLGARVRSPASRARALASRTSPRRSVDSEPHGEPHPRRGARAPLRRLAIPRRPRGDGEGLRLDVRPGPRATHCVKAASDTRRASARSHRVVLAQRDSAGAGTTRRRETSRGSRHPLLVLHAHLRRASPGSARSPSRRTPGGRKHGCAAWWARTGGGIRDGERRTRIRRRAAGRRSSARASTSSAVASPRWWCATSATLRLREPARRGLRRGSGRSHSLPPSRRREVVRRRAHRARRVRVSVRGHRDAAPRRRRRRRRRRNVDSAAGRLQTLA